jgi:hypothetical protein
MIYTETWRRIKLDCSFFLIFIFFLLPHILLLQGWTISTLISTRMNLKETAAVVRGRTEVEEEEEEGGERGE